MRTLGSLCERPRDTRQPLPSSDAAMGLAGAGARRTEPRGVRASEAAKVTGEGAGGDVFLKRKTKKARGREGAADDAGADFGVLRQWPRGCSQAHPGVRGLAVIYSCLFPFSSLYSRKKKKKS